MIRILTAKRLLGALALALPLAACGNDPNQNLFGKGMTKRLTTKKEAPKQVTQQDVNSALSGTSGPLEFITREDKSAWSFILQIETNGPYATFGNSARQTLTMRNGVVTSTRGLGGDLMSSDLTGVLPLIQGRRAGTATRIMRHLNGEDETVETAFSCTVTPGKMAPVKLGAVNTSARQVTERCTSDKVTFTNTYLVDSGGRSLGSRQWLSPEQGSLLFQTLRR